MRVLFFLFAFLLSVATTNAQFRPFRFAFISDTHIGSPNGSAEEDLRRTVRDINAMKDIVFVILTGDITEMGTNDELKLAKQILDSLTVPWYIIPGNHDTGWSESGGVMFTTVFGYDKFSFEYAGIKFLGCASGPYVRMSDGHVPRDAVNWLDKELKKVKKDQPVIFLNHYPVDNGLDNWYEITDRLRNKNTRAILCGHGHANKSMNFEDIPAVMGRSNLRAKEDEGGYNLVDVRNDSILFTVRRPVSGKERKWTGIKAETKYYDQTKKFTRPDYSVNDTYSQVKKVWEFSSDANIISTPAVDGEMVFVGNQNGVMTCFTLGKGKPVWKFKTSGSIFSSPAVANNKVVFGSGDGHVYCLDTKKGKLIWKYKTEASVLGSPVINGDTVFIGGSDHSFLALNNKNGQLIWKFTGLAGPVVSTPLLYNDKIVFGAWDRHLYAVNRTNGILLWKWNNGSSVRNFSPASCIPVVADGVIYIMAPDRVVSAIEASTGKTLWRSKDGGVRESIGISEDGKWIYGKSMQDTIVVYATSRDQQFAAWKLHAGFGYEHVPSMLIEKNGLVFFGTRNGVVYCIDPSEKKVVWAHKIDNSMVNTVRVISKNRLVVSTMDGKLVLLDILPG
jgi:outer membrane protein assembly factor BamB/predicted phosphodiesterase